MCYVFCQSESLLWYRRRICGGTQDLPDISVVKESVGKAKDEGTARPQSHERIFMLTWIARLAGKLNVTDKAVPSAMLLHLIICMT